MTRTYIVYGRAGYYPADSDIAQYHSNIGRLPRTVRSTVIATSASDACGQVAAWFKRQQTEALEGALGEVLGNIPRHLLFEPVAVTEVVPTVAELFAMAEQQAAAVRAHNINWALANYKGPDPVKAANMSRKIAKALAHGA